MSAGKSSRLLAAGFVTAIFILTAVLVWSPQVFADSTANASWGISGYSTKPGDGTGPSFGGHFFKHSNGACYAGNPQTGGCSCPGGYWASHSMTGLAKAGGCSNSEWGGCWAAEWFYGYICVK